MARGINVGLEKWFGVKMRYTVEDDIKDPSWIYKKFGWAYNGKGKRRREKS